MNLDLQVVRSGKIGMTAGAPLIDPDGKRPHTRNPLGDFLAQQHAAATGLSALTDHHLDGVRRAQVIRVHAIAGRQVLIDQRLG